MRNFGQTAAHDIRFDFVNHPTVAAYEDTNLRRAARGRRTRPAQRTATSRARDRSGERCGTRAISREELGGAIRSRFDGTLTYSDRPRPGAARRDRELWNKRQTFETKVSLDWATLQPVQRLELMTTHDLAKREKQKLELLRSVLTYFHYASKETQPDVFRAEIDRMNRPSPRPRTAGAQRQFDQTTELDFPWIKNGAAGRDRAPRGVPTATSGRIGAKYHRLEHPHSRESR